MPEHPGEGMTASRDTRPAPHIHHTGDLHPQQNSHIVPPGPQPVCAGPDHGQDRSSSLRCGRSVLTDGPHPALPAQRPTTTKTTERTALTEPTPSGMTIAPRPHPDRVPPVMPDLSSSLVGTPSAYAPRMSSLSRARSAARAQAASLSEGLTAYHIDGGSRPVGRPGSRPRHAELRVGAARRDARRRRFPRTAL